MLPSGYIQQNLREVEGLPHPDWRPIYDWIKANTAEADKGAAWFEVIDTWMTALISRLGPEYRITRTDERFILVSGGKLSDPDSLLQFAKDRLHQITTLLPDLTKPLGHGPRLVLVFDHLDHYYSYISAFYPDGVHQASGGIQVRHWYRHIAINGVTPRLHSILIHELVHLRLSDFATPRWLEEGLAQYLPDYFLGEQAFRLDLELIAKQKAKWMVRTLQDFWNGKAFSFPLAGISLAYQLAAILTRNLITDYPDEIKDFVRLAERSDAGAAAAKHSLGKSLGAIAAGFLGGDQAYWEPRLPLEPPSRPK